MDYFGKAVALTIDSVIFAICLRQYFHCKNAISAIKHAEFHEVGPNLNEIVQNSDTKAGYVAIRGVIKPLGVPLRSIHSNDVKGVVQKLTVKEHVIARTTTGFWSDQERVVQKVYNSVPFVLQKGYYQVEVSDALAADILDMDTVSDLFEPSVLTFMDHLWGFFTGVRQRGLQSTEEMLREGSVITGIGKLVMSDERPDSLILQPPSDGAPFYLTTMSINSLLRTLDDRRQTYKLLCLMFGTIGIVIGGILIRRVWKDRQERRIAKELREELAASRKERRQRVRDTDLREDQLCTICRTNPREIIILPCGHVCLCEDCSDSINSDCPICRRAIGQKVPAYIV